MAVRVPMLSSWGSTLVVSPQIGCGGERLALVAFPGLASQAAWVSLLLLLRYPLVSTASVLSAPLLQHHFAKP